MIVCLTLMTKSVWPKYKKTVYRKLKILYVKSSLILRVKYAGLISNVCIRLTINVSQKKWSNILAKLKYANLIFVLLWISTMCLRRCSIFLTMLIVNGVWMCNKMLVWLSWIIILIYRAVYLCNLKQFSQKFKIKYGHFTSNNRRLRSMPSFIRRLELNIVRGVKASYLIKFKYLKLK